MDMSDFHLKRIDVTTPYLTLGMRHDVERKLGMDKGKSILMSSSGDLELLSIFYALLIARTSLLDIDGDIVKTLVSYPSMYADAVLKKYASELLVLNGVPSRLEISYMPVKNVDEMNDVIGMLDGFDVYFNPYFDYHLVDPKSTMDILSLMNEMKDGRIMLMNRFHRRKKTLTSAVDTEIIVTADRYLPSNVSFIPVQKMTRGTVAGTYRVSSLDKKTRVSCNLKYPSTFC